MHSSSFSLQYSVGLSARVFRLQMKQNGPTALYKALSHGNASFAIHLIQRGASLNDLNLHEFTLDEFYLVCARLMVQLDFRSLIYLILIRFVFVLGNQNFFNHYLNLYFRMSRLYHSIGHRLEVQAK